MNDKHMDSLDQPLVSGREEAPNKLNLKLDTLSRLQVFGYSIGHFQNDLCAACWFNYMLYFIKNVVFANSADSGFYAGIVFLSGQIADGISTPLVGVFSDKTNTKLGKRTPWYIGGTIIVTVSFLFIFQQCLFCQWFDSSPAMMTFYYILFPSLFNVGWASVQVSHMSLVPSLTLSRRQRDKLNAMRNTFTYIANLFVLLGAFIIFLTIKHAFEEFSILSFMSVGLGLFTSIFFLFTLPEKKLSEDCIKLRKVLENHSPSDLRASESHPPAIKDVSRIKSEDDAEKYRTGRQAIQGDQSNIILPENEDGTEEIKLSFSRVHRQMDQTEFPWIKWFKMASFYIYGVVYMGSRILVNVQSSLIIFYLQNVLGIARGQDTYSSGVPLEFALIPMLIYLCSTITSITIKIGYEKFGRKRIYAFGTFVAVINAIVMMFLEETSANWMFGLSVLIGFSQSVCLNTGINLISEVVGVRGSNAAFVFGAYSLLDKVANGIILYAIMNIKDVSDYANVFYTRICSSIIPAAGALLACIFVIIGHAKDYDSGDIVTDGSIIKASEAKDTMANCPLNSSGQKNSVS